MSARDELHRLAERAGVQTGYWATDGVYHEAADDTLRTVLATLGVEVGDDPSAAHRELDRAWTADAVEPVVVTTAGAPLVVDVRAPADRHGRLDWTLTTEDGVVRDGSLDLDGVHPHDGREVDGRGWSIRRLDTGVVLDVGYHRLRVDGGGPGREAVVLCAPSRLHQLPDDERWWGVFAPTYALVPGGAPGTGHLGIGHLGDLGHLGSRVGELGGRVVSTLPLLATYLGDPYEPSPYSPVSRRWWNELYLDPARLPGLDESPRAGALLGSQRLADAAADLAADPLVDHAAAVALVHEVLDAVVADLDVSDGPAAAALRRHAVEHPELERYARFRALVERRREGWPAWPEPQRSGAIDDRDVDPAVVARHRYAQWAVDTQLADLAADFRSRGQALALDLPLGANPAGFDTWSDPDLFAAGTATGAPPDDFFSAGQNWGFPPPHPVNARRHGHRELVAATRLHVRHTGLLRIDHLMSLERLWWIPQGAAATDGAYVRYPTDELFAVVAIESYRARAAVVGENLGTVTDDVNAAMQRWGMLGMYELQFETWGPVERDALGAPDPDSVAGLNTHDMPTFAGYWAGADIGVRRELGLIDDDEADQLRAERRHSDHALVRVLGRDLGRDVPAEPGPAMAASLEWLGATDARVVLATLEDLWLEDRPQNVPGTHLERPNWRRRATRSVDAAFDDPDVVAPLRALARRRPTTPEESS
jgi:4-alpha-glucanotransferase